MNTELLEALNILEEEKEISKETLLDAIENSLLNACKNHFGKADNIKVDMNRTTCEYQLYAEKVVVEEVEDKLEEISYEDAKGIDSRYELGDIFLFLKILIIYYLTLFLPDLLENQILGILGCYTPEGF